MKMSKLAALLVAAAVSMGTFASCSGDSSSKKDEKDSKAENSSSADNSGNAEDVPVSQTHTNDPMTETSAIDLVKKMSYGWNLGNTMDASGNGLEAETAWLPTKAETNQYMIDMLEPAGFNVLRIPVSWDGHITGDDYQIDPAWMDRVQEIVNYGIDDGLYVILNTHHEEWYMPKASEKEQDIEEIKAVWAQIADRFKGYDEHLIFEGLNEPRLRGEPAEWTGTTEAREIINEYEKAFVETVRASGGNNADRCLMITGYAASSAQNNLSAIELPEDSDKLIISVHAYLPYSFALDTKGTDVYDLNDTSIPDFFNTLNELFISRGIPVIVGEFGSVNKDNIEQRVKCLEDYLTAASNYDIPCIWWDNYARIGGGENFGLLNRAEYDWYFPQMMDVFKKYAESDPSANAS
ncbi:glycoside hydrolase family 5 protein [Ruminococcus sp.]|uniref:glycoside hydrolase family 5 protein n=1 Tax=Ruminococcus sp. TaxID=41978 RepID=UPI00260103EE|nr:glycoside hydrolase family 5 protein [Ruminococcus sp.]MBQ8966306.1 glycoside hydrolase family 5 protein [Ruminococcus sp.]